MDLLRHGGMGRVLTAGRAPSTLGTFLRAFTFGHVRQLDAVASRVLVNLAARAPLLVGAGDRRDPAAAGLDELRQGAGRLVADALVTAAKAGATGVVTVRADSAYYNHDVIAAARTGGARFSVTARMGPPVTRAIIEKVIAELKAGPLAHLPSGQMNADAAWLVLAAIAFNLTRAAGTLASRFHAKATTATIRAQLITVPARIARSARRLRLHLPQRWPWCPASSRWHVFGFGEVGDRRVGDAQVDVGRAVLGQVLVGSDGVVLDPVVLGVGGQVDRVGDLLQEQPLVLQ